MGFILMLIISLTTLVQVEIASTTHSKNELLARQNAYMGVMTALGELQKLAGPDARVTARSDIFLGPDGLEDTLLRQPYWLGIWHSQNPDGSTMDHQDYLDWNAKTPQEKIAEAYWLVSGNEGLTPDDEGYLTPLIAMPEDDATVVIAGGAADYDVAEVRASKVSIERHQEAGHYAYWVSGDNSKALVNAFDPAIASTDHMERNRAFQIASRSGISAVSGLENFSPEDPWLERIMDLDSGYHRWASDQTEDVIAMRRARFHDLTAWSKGLLVDVKDGALKRDLTQAFEINASFEAHFPEQRFADKEASDHAASDPMTPEPYYLIEDQVTVSGSPNWDILRDYYQHYWPTYDSNNKTDDWIDFRKATEEMPDGRLEQMFIPHRRGGIQFSDPYISTGLPYQYTSETSDEKGDNYQKTSWITPTVVQIRISHSFELVSEDSDGNPITRKDAEGNIVETAVPVISFRPVVSLYNPYNTSLDANDFGFVFTLNPKISLTLSLSSGTRTVEFYQAELHTANKQGILKISLGAFSLEPGAIIHEAFNGSPYASVESQSTYKQDYMKPDWTAVGGLRFPLDKIDEDHFPDAASENGSVSYEEAKSAKQNQWHPQWGISEEERQWLQTAVEENAPIEIEVEYEDFGEIRFFTNSSAAGQGYQKIVDMWRPNSDAQPETFSTSFGSLSGATAQDSFETIAFSLRTTERMGGTLSQTDALRNLIDLNVRAIHSNSNWDGNTGGSRYLSLYDGEALGQNEQEPESYTDPTKNTKHGYWGRSTGSIGQTNVVLFDRPRGPLLSLGQLQHANLGRYHFDPTYVVGNSYANPRIPLAETKINHFGNTNELTYFDLPYLVNERLWDGFFFSTLNIPRTTEMREQVMSEMDEPTASLSDYTLNPRMEFIGSNLPNSERYRRILGMDAEDGQDLSAIYRPASEMWVNGAFNINSTSVEAWKAILSSSLQLSFPVYKTETHEIVQEDGVVFSRVSRPYNRGFHTNDVSSQDEYWKGYRVLTSAELDDLAESIVEQVKVRGPFLSLSSFVNRQLNESDYGKKGALQAALDDPALGIDSALAVNSINQSDAAGEAVSEFAEITNFLPENLSPTDCSSMGFPGHVLQGDILQQIGPLLTVRSDTFTIRAYGDVVDPFTKEVTARTWCEVKVQRHPNPMPALEENVSDIDELIQPSSPYGRRFEIVSFRWLEADEI